MSMDHRFLGNINTLKNIGVFDIHTSQCNKRLDYKSLKYI